MTRFFFLLIKFLTRVTVEYQSYKNTLTINKKNVEKKNTNTCFGLTPSPVSQLCETNAEIIHLRNWN